MSKPRPERSGSALFIVLVAAALLLVVTFVFATASVSSLHFASGYYANAQGDQLARAAVTQFVLEAESQYVKPLVNPYGHDTGAQSLPPAEQNAWLERFETEPVFKDGAAALGAQAYLTFDTDNPYYSVDNSGSETSAAGWSDRGRASRSVPPFCYDLVFRIVQGSRVSYHEAVVQRRWNYALVSQAPLILRGTPKPESSGLSFEGFSQIYGNVYILGSELPSNGSPLGEEDMKTAPLAPQVCYRIRAGLDTWLNGPGSPVWVGGPSFNPFVDPGRMQGDSRQNLLQGRVDFEASDGTVRVEPSNTFDGQIRVKVKPKSLQRLEDLVQIPSEEAVGELLSMTMVTDYLNPVIGKNGQISYPKIAALDKNLYLGGPWPGAGELPGGALMNDVVAGDRFQTHKSVSNHYVKKTTTTDSEGNTVENITVIVKPTSMHLKNCALFVRGGLDLSGASTGITGENATLIVDGTLVLNEGNLDALNQGMVVGCRRLIAACSGEFHGLILVTESAVFRPPEDDPDGMTIQGGIVCGGTPLYVDPEPLLEPWNYSSNPPTPPPPAPLAYAAAGADIRTPLSGMNLYNTSVTYDPRFLKRLNPAGQCRILLLRRLE